MYINVNYKSSNFVNPSQEISDPSKLLSMVSHCASFILFIRCFWDEMTDAAFLDGPVFPTKK